MINYSEIANPIRFLETPRSLSEYVLTIIIIILKLCVIAVGTFLDISGQILLLKSRGF